MKIGLYIGRFQPLHKGHETLIRKALEQVDCLIIAIGSAQESETERNPLNLQERLNILGSCFANEVIEKKIIFLGINDREKPKEDSSWGEYVLEKIKLAGLETPNIIFSGNESKTNTWFPDLEVVSIPREDIPISATQMREYIKNNQYEKWVEFAPSGFYPEKLFNFLKTKIKREER